MVVLTSAAATTRAKKPSGIDRTSVCRLADVRRQRYSAFAGYLAAQNDPAAARVDVTQLQSRHLEPAQPTRATSGVLMTGSAAAVSRFATLEAAQAVISGLEKGVLDLGVRVVHAAS
jgi:hypothetical protein